ncbi:glycosyltransferase family 4 protein [Luteirhabdus pelagi]|uniref:glycosyltransferase family 4 protein n=1 Tax=Luteirhabdus pelagi TaxID=2792783 RepID=UPI00193941D5|nr:glycosyltransferase family 4 protein [Luteirhabdus pelagi]
MRRILYVGNKRKHERQNPTTIDTLSELLQQEGFSVIKVSSISNKLFRLMHMVYTVVRKRNKVDVVLIDTYSTLNFTYAVWVGRLCRYFNLPYIPILHGGNLPKRLAQNPDTCRKLFGNAHQNIAPSQFLKNAFEEFGFSNITYIPNSLDISAFPFKNRTISEPLKILWVRAFAELYNPMLAIKAAQLLNDKNIRTELTMVGPEKDASMDVCKDYVEQYALPVTFTGALDRTEWTELAKEFHIFLNTTNVDNTPLSVIEAMALGLPIVSTNVGGIPFLVEDGVDGLLVPPNNVEVLVTTLETLVANPTDTREMMLKARKKAEQFSWHAVKEKWNMVLNS